MAEFILVEEETQEFKEVQEVGAGPAEAEALVSQESRMEAAAAEDQEDPAAGLVVEELEANQEEALAAVEAGLEVRVIPEQVAVGLAAVRVVVVEDRPVGLVEVKGVSTVVIFSMARLVAEQVTPKEADMEEMDLPADSRTPFQVPQVQTTLPTPLFQTPDSIALNNSTLDIMAMLMLSAR